ncbi:MULTISPECIES: AAA-like domain-containing protein [unclassified Leptolyngbya]|uniref:AAA-like domain-containing protein n=1 Tax=unclassified Leptolyngbya TaxID=2650499 RepID=UPI001689968F|nr:MULTISPECIES: AAA-like domain-containing protein [unclassified Leptolyngbya]MBD1913161.1 AAA-like domain-containing protein [Leptolyngbya sp. FACHB-8]MBD2158800.1 AAA-like domain-containing protein [Leptolyngbya sp. FACHB-16]
MREAEFKVVFEELTPKQRKVLQRFLAAETDEAIASALYLEPSTIRRHIANICKAFGLNNAEGEHYSYRDELIELFAHHRPELVNPELVYRGKLANLEFPGSPLTLKSPFYVERPPIEEQCLQEICKPGSLVRIRAPQYMGKTSLLHRILARASEMNYATVRLNLRQAEAAVAADLDTFLRWFCVNLSRKLNLPGQLDEYWDGDRFGSLVSCTTYFQSCILEQLHQNLVLGLDEVDWLFEFPPVAQGFFALLRSWHEEANNLDIWQRLRLVVAHSTEVYISLNLNQSPFNVGLPIRLPELSLIQVQGLAKQYGWHSSTQAVQSLVSMVGGHPYLLQLAFYHLQQGMPLEHLLQTAPTQAGIYRDHLRRHWQMLQDHPELQTALDLAMVEESRGISLDPVLAYKLESSGLIKLEGNQARLSCELYRQYFSDRL